MNLLKPLNYSSRSEITSAILFPEGLPAFEKQRHFVLISNEEEAPFLWLQSQSNQNLSFITIDPFLIHTNYRPDVSEEDIKYLKIDKQEDVAVISIVNIRNNNEMGVTANLLSPILINWKERLGKQVILQNHQKYSVRYPIKEKV